MNAQFAHHAVDPDFDIHRRLRGVHDGDHLTLLHRVAGADFPLQQRALVHVGAERGKLEFDHFPSSSRTAATIFSACGSAASSMCLA